ncbi:MAG: DUF2937 family protein [Pseudomonadota bacterium]
MILRIIALAFGLTGAASLSQFPEFAQQYLQRLAGKVDQLEVQVAQIDASAAGFDMSREDYLADLSTSRTGAAAAEKAADEIALFDRLSQNISAFREAGAFGRLTQGWRVADMDLAQKTLGDYQPAVPLTAEGAGFAALGFAAGWGIWWVLGGILGWPFRRRRRKRRDNMRLRERETEARVVLAQAADEEDDEVFVEYEGDVTEAISRSVPSLRLAAHDGSMIDLATLTAPVALFTYPIMGRPGVAFPDGWNEVDEADNATALACSFRDSYDMVRAAGIEEVYGISAQSVADQREAAHRLALPFLLLSDPRMSFAFDLNLPRFILHHHTYVAPSILVIQRGRILAALHPVREAATAAPRLLRELAQAEADQRKAEMV